MNSLAEGITNGYLGAVRDANPMLATLSGRHVRALAFLGELRSIHRVAAALHVSQPAVSKMLAEIERRMEMQLFKRSVRGVEPTEAGALLIRHACAVQSEIRRAAEDLQALASGRPETLRIGSLPSSSATLVPPAVNSLRKELPRLSISLVEGNFDFLADQLDSARIDVLVGRLGFRAKTVDWEERFVAEESVRIVARTGHPLSGKGPLSWAALRPYEWILPAPGTGLRGRIDMLLTEMRAPPTGRLLESGSLIFSLALLKQSDAILPLPGALAEHYRATGQLDILPIALPPMFGHVGVIWRRSASPSPARERFVELLARETRTP